MNLTIQTKQWQEQLRSHNTLRQWEKQLNKTLGRPQRLQREIQMYDRVTRYQYGNVIVEQFHDIDVETLWQRPRSNRKTEYAHQMLKAAEFYERIPVNCTYIAVDSNQQRIVAVFPNAIKEIYGNDDVATSLKHNITAYVNVKSPSRPKNSRHSSMQQWMKDHPHLQHCGTFQWGLWEEQGHPQRGPTVSKDLMVTQARIAPKLRMLLASFGNITRAVNILFGATDKDTRDAYHEAFLKIPSSHSQFIQTTDEVELFSLRVLLINVWTQPHRDSNDWNGGWAWIAALGDFTGGDFCITELERRIPFPHGTILGLRGGALEHWTTHWDGQCRYSLVHVFHEYVRSWDSEEYPSFC